MPVEWTTNEQKTFLQEELIEFKQIGGRRYTKQWSTLFQKWFQRWPEHSVTLPDMPAETALTDEQKGIVTKAVVSHREQLRRWMHWHAGAGQNRCINNKMMKIMDDLLKPKMRVKKPWEVYSNMYYKMCIQPRIEAGLSIADVNKKIREMFENKTPEIKHEVYKAS